ncbi:nickel pincer cofactor biosynthesis protein LarB [Pendulispora rubella]|uniref:Nickel pincer cofactor biosynthesis protein LarB n=1 Tax=Pendulispora rubella TaxID=2741070 RepID=A0ABZ2LDH3_9BACT
MDPAKLRELLEQVQSGARSVDDAALALKDLPFADLGYAVVDHHRALRQGVPEVILGQSKTAAQIVGIATEVARTGQNVLVSRLDPAKAHEVCRAMPALRYHEMARVATLEQAPIPRLGTRPVAVVTAGTSDLPVSEECAETLRMLGAEVERVYDVGVAGIHRLLHRRQALDATSVIIVIAGMEGALASVVGGLVEGPVIAVPTSVGYGAAFEGLAALLGMLTSCASGVTVVNIDNGFGAAFAAARILRAGARG